MQAKNLSSLIILQITTIFFLLTIYSCSNVTSSTEQQVALPDTFEKLCASCHGEDLKGGIAQSLLDGSWQFGGRKNDIFRVIKFGLPHHGMPSWGTVLSDDEINELVAFITEEEERLGVNESVIPSSLETQDYQVNIEVYAEGLETPWSIDFISKDQALITERQGRLRIVEAGVLLPDSISGSPQVTPYGQGGLLDVTIDPDYQNNGWIYLSYSHGVQSDQSEERIPTMTKIVRGRIDKYSWIDEQVLF